MKSKILGLLAVALLTGPVGAQAALITVYFQTTIDSIVFDQAELFPGNGIAVGSVLDGFYVYDDTATNQDCCASNEDVWPLVEFSINLPGAVTPELIVAVDSGTSDLYRVIALYEFAPFVTGRLRPGITGDFGYGSELGPGTGHLIKPPPVFDTPLPSLTVADYSVGGLSGFARGTTTFSLTPFSSVPEPGTLALLGLGLLGLSLTRRRMN